MNINSYATTNILFSDIGDELTEFRKLVDILDMEALERGARTKFSGIQKTVSISTDSCTCLLVYLDPKKMQEDGAVLTAVER